MGIHARKVAPEKLKTVIRHPVRKIIIKNCGNRGFLKNDKNFIRLPRQDLMPKQRITEISHLWAEWYLIYTPFTPFKVNYPMR